MDCGHTFCNDCWRQHCLTQIEDGRARKLLCMGVRCNIVCDEDKVRHVAVVQCMELVGVPRKVVCMPVYRHPVHVNQSQDRTRAGKFPPLHSVNTLDHLQASRFKCFACTLAI